MYKINTIFFEKILSSLLYILPIALVTSSFMSDFCVSVASLIFIILIIYKKEFFYLKNKFFFFFIIWNFYLIIISLISDNLYLSLESSLFYFRFGIYSLSIWYLLDNFRNFHKYFFYSFIGVFIFVIIDAFFQLFNGENFFGFPDMDSNGNKRLSGIFNEEFVLGSFLSRLLPVLIGILFLNQLNKKLETSLIISIIIFTNVIVFLSGERSAFFYSIISSLIILFFLVNGKLIKLITISLSLIFITMISLNFNHGKDRILNLTIKQFNFFGNNTSNGIEFNDLKLFSIQHEVIYKTSLKIFNDNKFFGIGPKMFRIICDNDQYYTYTKLDGSINGCQTHSHNTYIQLLTETGIVGTIPIILVFLFSVNYLFKVILLRNITTNNIFFFKTCMFTALFVSLWPFIPTGNFFNNWINSIYYMPVGFLLYYYNSNKINNN